MARIRFRPHHFLCALGFEGKGYSKSFAANMSAIVDGRLRGQDGDDQEIQVVPDADDICAPCPKLRSTLCSVQAKIKVLDRAHAHALNLAPREVLTWGEAKARIVAQVPPGSLNTLCKGCQWEPYGMCEKALSALHETQNAAPKDGVKKTL